MKDMNLDFKKDVLKKSHQTPIVVDFWAEWCGPCKVLGPILEHLDSEAAGKWQLVKLNTEHYPQLAAEYGIRGIPAVKMFYRGEVIAEFVGALPEIQVRRWLEEHLPTKSKTLLAEAQAALAANDSKRAEKLLQEAVAEDAGNFDARILLAQIRFESAPQDAAALVAEVPPEHPQFNVAEAIQNLVRLSTNYDTTAKSAQDGKAWRHYLAGIQALQKHDYEKALQQWIETLILDRTIDDDGPRKACVSVFTYFGQHHELTQKYHRAFTSALF